MMHGRAGAYSTNARGRYDAATLSQRHMAWGGLWAAQGYIALLVDGFGPRGYATMPQHRPNATSRRAGTDEAVERIATAQRGRRLQFTDDVPLVERSAAVTGKPSTPALPVHSCAIDGIGHDSGAQHK